MTSPVQTLGFSQPEKMGTPIYHHVDKRAIFRPLFIVALVCYISREIYVLVTQLQDK